jgi:hypothetical protein
MLLSLNSRYSIVDSCSWLGRMDSIHRIPIQILEGKDGDVLERHHLQRHSLAIFRHLRCTLVIQMLI